MNQRKYPQYVDLSIKILKFIFFHYNMQILLSVALILLATFLLITAFCQKCNNGIEKLQCQLIEYSQPPNDSEDPLGEDEINQLNEAFLDDESDSDYDELDDEYEYAEQTGEDFRVISGGGRMDGGRRSGGRIDGGRRSGGRVGRRGYRGGRGWSWRSWPRRYWGRPWRSWYWRTYPDYIYTYPTTYYDYNWVAPVQRFTIRLGPKDARNPMFNKGYNKGFTVLSGSGTGCGTSGARIDLIRGYTYEFDVYTAADCQTGMREDEPFFFTTSSVGGNSSSNIFNVSPTTNGTIRITVTDNLPNQFYYQSTNNRYVGGPVYVHNE